jgi:hypothetical protein
MRAAGAHGWTGGWEHPAQDQDGPAGLELEQVVGIAFRPEYIDISQCKLISTHRYPHRYPHMVSVTPLFGGHLQRRY